MSQLQFETELKQWQAKLLSLYSEGQQLFLRHMNVATDAPAKVMPHLEEAKKHVAAILGTEKTTPTD